MSATAQKADARATVLGVRSGPQGPRPEFVIADSEIERTAVAPSYPAAVTAAATGRPGTAVETAGSQQIGETAIARGAARRARDGCSCSRPRSPRWPTTSR